jgi:predicted N-acetyltransferase YhbS
MSTPPYVIRSESPLDAEAIERLHERAFGPGRFARSAYRLREGEVEQTPQYCLSALVGSLLVGSLRMSPVRAGATPALILGPLTVDPAFEGIGIGGALIREGLARAKAGGETLVLLVGDEPYYKRFGFAVVPRDQLIMPGPVDPARFLAVELADGALTGASGPVRPRHLLIPPPAGV